MWNGPALTAVTFQRNVTLLPGLSDPSGYVSTYAEERSSGSSRPWSYTRGVRVGIRLTMNRGRAGSATPRCVVRYEKPPVSPPLGEPPEPPFDWPLHLTVTEMTGISFRPGLRTWITMLDVVASRCADGKLA